MLPAAVVGRIVASPTAAADDLEAAAAADDLEAAAAADDLEAAAADALAAAAAADDLDAAAFKAEPASARAAMAGLRVATGARRSGAGLPFTARAVVSVELVIKVKNEAESSMLMG